MWNALLRCIMVMDVPMLLSLPNESPLRNRQSRGQRNRE
jgi:hypothetical protein